MNHIYKVIWNKAKHCYTVVSEIAKSHSDSTKRVRVGTTAALMAVAVLTGFAMPAQAAVSIGTDGTVKAEAADINALNNLLKNGVTTNKDGSVTVGGLTVKKNGEVSVNSPDVVYGKNAKIIWDSNNTMGQISIGNNATAITGRGGQERAFAYDGDVNHAAGAIAIGANTYARTGSIMIGSHVYKGNMGDVTGIDTDSFNTDSNGAYGFTVNSTTIGTNSFTRGNLATTIGDYNIQSGKSRGYGWNSLLYGAQNFGATVIGALNSNESQSAGSGMSGIANSIVGVANKVNSSNGTLVFGAGNEVTNSLTGIYGVDDTTSLRDATAAQNALKNAVAESDAGGAVLAIGGANKADWARKSQLIGVGNTLTGASSAVSEYNMINGYKNEVTNATHTSIIGSNNKAKNIKLTIVMGDENTLEGRQGVISLGNQNTIEADDAVAIGNGTTVTAENGVAIGLGSVADRVAGKEKGVVGAFAPEKIDATNQSTWTSTAGAVSVGDTVNNITRQITNVAAGSEDTDAVNVAQLKQVNSKADSATEMANKGWNLTTGVVTDATQVKPGDTVDFSGDKNISVSHKGTDVSIALKDTLTLGSNATDGYVTVDGVKGTVWAGHAVSAGNVNMDGDSGEITGLTNTTLNSKDFATTGRAATEEQLKLVKNQADSAATEASKHSKVVNGSNITVEETDQDGQKTYKVGLNKNLEGIESISNGDAKINLNDTGVVISKGKDKTFSITDTGMGMSVIGDDYVTRSIMVGKNGTVISGGLSVAGSKITNVAAGSEDTDAVNVAQLKKVNSKADSATEMANKGWNLTTGVVTDATQVKPGDTVDFSGDKNISVSHKGTDVSIALKDTLTLGSNATDGYVTVDGVKGTVWAGHAVSAGNVNMDGDSGEITGLTNTTLNSKDFATTGRAATEEQLKLVKNQADSAATEASKHSKVVNGSNITVEETDQDGQKTYKVGLNKNLEGIESISNGDAKINLNDTGVVISKGKDKTFSITDTGMGMSVIGDDYVTRSIMVGKNGTVISGGLSVAGSKITNVAAGSEDTDAVNVGQLKEAVEAGNTDTHIKAGEYGVGTDNKVNMQLVDKNGKDAGTVTITDVAKASDVGDVNNIASDIKNQDGKTTVVDAVNNLNNKVGDLQYSKVEKGEIADGDSTTTAIGKLDQKLTDVAATAAKHTKVEGSSNITVTNTAKEGEAANYKVELKKDIEVNTVNANSVTTGQTVMNKDGLKVGEKVSVTENGLKVGDMVSVTENAVTAGQTSISDAGVKVGENTYISDKGLNANSNKITNVADGEENSDAVNYGQLKKSETTINNRIDGVENQVISNSNRINQLGDRVNKVGAGAAALAALHPLDFDPDDKWDFAAGYGNYNGENAAAIGAYYRPNEDTMFSVGGSFGNGENMVNAGVSLKLGQGNHVSTSKVAMAKEIKDLRKELEGLKSALLDVNAGKKLDTSKLQLFPDVPKNHWAYEYVSTLKGNGVLTGYPDGEFKGDRPMTRYEFATMLYKAMLEGATLSDRILKEFAPELERFTVDTVHQDKDGKPTVERVRTVKAKK